VRTRQRRGLAYRKIPVTEEIFGRAIDVQGELSKSGRHRVPIPDLLVAAAAEAGGLTVLHYDGDYDIIASVTAVC
jgi:predicted nucleic acid-binding protein